MGNMKGFTKAMLLCGAAAMIGCASPAFAKNIHAEMAQKRAAQASLEKKSKELVTEVGALKTKLVGMAREVRETEDQLGASDKALKDLQTRREGARASLNREYEAIGSLIAAAGKYNRTPTPQLLLQSDPLDAARASLIMKRMIPTLHDHTEALKLRIADMARIEKDITARRAEQSAQLKKLGRQQDELSGLLQERQISYKKTEGDRKQHETELAALAREAKSLADLERRLRERTAAAKKPSPRIAKSSIPLPSVIVQPVAGTVRTGFGETDEMGAVSQGLTFAARPGATVVTPLSGKVKFAGPFQKYKQILIIEHSGGYHSLIAGLGAIDTVVGAKLDAGEPVGKAESADGAKIYYELRRGGEPVNPRPSMIAQQKQDKS